MKLKKITKWRKPTNCRKCNQEIKKGSKAFAIVPNYSAHFCVPCGNKLRRFKILT